MLRNFFKSKEVTEEIVDKQRGSLALGVPIMLHGGRRRKLIHNVMITKQGGLGFKEKITRQTSS